jgi:hypothetical protein
VPSRREERTLSETEDFLGLVLPRLMEADTALHQRSPALAAPLCRP